MNTIHRLVLGVVTLGSLALLVRAAEPAPARSAGRVLVLDNERTLEGDIERHGEQYRVRRAIGETWVPGAKVLRLCADREEAYQYLRSRANLADPDERCRLAQWCLLNNLRAQALAEVTAAVALRPNDPESRRLLRGLQRSATPGPETAAAGKVEAVQVLQPALDLNTESMSLFITKVQPILMNACANCHATGKGGDFHLLRAFDSTGSNRRTLQTNVSAVLAQLQPTQPQVSPLLVKAVSAHGGDGQPPLRGKQAPAYRTLEEWVLKTVANNPQLQSPPAVAAVLPAPAEAKAPEVVPVKVEVPAPASLPAKPAETSGFATGRPAEPETKPAAQPPSPGAAPADPFDPDVFNRQVHPEPKKSP